MGDGREALAGEGHLGAEEGGGMGREGCSWEESKLLSEELRTELSATSAGVALRSHALRTLSLSWKSFSPGTFYLVSFCCFLRDFLWVSKCFLLILCLRWI